MNAYSGGKKEITPVEKKQGLEFVISIKKYFLFFKWNNIPRQKGSKNKLTSEIKQRLQKIIDQTLDSLDVDDMNINQKFKLLQLGLQFIMPRLATITIQEDSLEEEE